MAEAGGGVAEAEIGRLWPAEAWLGPAGAWLSSAEAWLGPAAARRNTESASLHTGIAAAPK